MKEIFDVLIQTSVQNIQSHQKNAFRKKLYSDVCDVYDSEGNIFIGNPLIAQAESSHAVFGSNSSIEILLKNVRSFFDTRIYFIQNDLDAL